jgi:hypothetical protein
MTKSGIRYGSAFSRRGVRPSFARNLSLEKRGSREYRVHAAPAVSCANCTRKNAHEHTGSAEAIRHSLRNGLTAYGALSPAIRICLSPSPRGNWLSRPVGPASPPKDLTPTMRRQDHTLLPYAAARLRQEASPGQAPFVLHAVRSLTRNSPSDCLRADAAASTASLPAFVTTRDRPSCRERTGRAGATDLPDGLSGILPVGLICRRPAPWVGLGYPRLLGRIGWWHVASCALAPLRHADRS